MQDRLATFRHFRTCLAIGAAVEMVVFTFREAFSSPAEQSQARDAAPRPLVDYINPMIGAGSGGGIHGKTFPGAATPFGLVQLSPDTITGGATAPASPTRTGR